MLTGAMAAGCNTDVRQGDATYHVQTEQTGTEKPQLETLVYRDGRILAARRVRHDALAPGARDEARAAELMRRQHQAIVAAIRSGRLRLAADALRRARRILVVDDEAETLALLERILSHAGHRVILLEDPRRALDVAREVRPDLVLCDLAMPGLNGYGVVRALSAHPDTARLPVAFLTAEHDLEQRVNAFSFGVVEYITKPLRPERLLQTLDALFQRLAARPRCAITARADQLLDELRREARTGTLTVAGAGGPRRSLVQTGVVADDDAPAAEAQAEFEDLDFDVEELLARDPSRPVDDGGTSPSFTEFPEALRVALLVDANTEFRGLLARSLAEQGFRVLEADDGKAAQVLVHEEWPWVLVTDTRLPGMDGFELCRCIRAGPCHSRLPILFLSGWHDSSHRARGLAAGGDHYLPKLTPVRQILVRLHMILGRFTPFLSAASEPVEATIDAVGVLPALRLLHLTRRTGVLNLRSGDRIIELRLRHGEVVGADSEAASGADALAEVLPWTHGELSFDPGEIEETPPLGRLTPLLASLCRRLNASTASGARP
jgi:DNA-binding response OmpR family regulator